MVASPKSKKSKRDEILDIATEQFLANGYVNASVNEMYRQSGISKETIYRHFGSKEALFLAVVDRELETYWDSMSAKFEYQGDAVEALTNFGAKLVALVTARRMMALRHLVFIECADHPQIGAAYHSQSAGRTYGLLVEYFTDQGAPQNGWRFEPGKLAEYFIAWLLHRVTFEQSCRVKPTPELSDCLNLAKDVSVDFLAACKTP